MNTPFKEPPPSEGTRIVDKYRSRVSIPTNEQRKESRHRALARIYAATSPAQAVSRSR